MVADKAPLMSAVLDLPRLRVHDLLKSKTRVLSLKQQRQSCSSMVRSAGKGARSSGVRGVLASRPGHYVGLWAWSASRRTSGVLVTSGRPRSLVYWAGVTLCDYYHASRSLTLDFSAYFRWLMTSQRRKYFVVPLARGNRSYRRHSKIPLSVKVSRPSLVQPELPGWALAGGRGLPLNLSSSYFDFSSTPVFKQPSDLKKEITWETLHSPPQPHPNQPT